MCAVFAHAAPAPVTWCGTTSATDQPDVVGGSQVHVIYATPRDSADRFPQLASAIAADIAAIGTWWRGQDKTRAPRFDLAAVACTGAGSLDISDVKLPHEAAYYNRTTTPRLALVRTDLVAAGFADIAKKYLVYYDQSQPAAGGNCGAAYVDAHNGGANGYAGVFMAPNLRGCEAPGSYLEVVAAHELVNAFGALATGAPGPPHACPDDPLHPCDNAHDVLNPAPPASLASARLDVGHDDYYDHRGTWWDVRDSAWLWHLDVPQYAVEVAVGDGGESVADATEPGLSCAKGETCTWAWEAGSVLTLTPTPQHGYRFLHWIGCPDEQAESCTFTVDRNATVAAVFAPPLALKGFHLSFARNPLTLTATLHLSVGDQADLVGCRFAKQPVVAATLNGAVATCTWSVPTRFRGHRIRGVVELDAKGETLLTKPFHVRIPQ